MFLTKHKGTLVVQRLILCIVIILCINNAVHAQEINGNGIDDDGDCNIDCNDRSLGLVSKKYSNGMPASFVIGQNNFTSNASGCDEYSMYWPYDVAQDPTTNKVFVSDLMNHRILRYASYDDFVHGNAPEVVFGQTNFTDNTEGCSSTKLRQPTGIFVDSTGSLWVTDWLNYRVLKYSNAASKATGAAADVVLGQSNFTSRIQATTSTGMDLPVEVFVDEYGVLWVADSGNDRVLRFDNANSKTSSSPADGVLGAPNFTSTGSGVNSSNVGSSGGLVVICNSLYVSDVTYNRVLRWDDPSAKANGAAADGVLGQSNFTTSTSGVSQNKLNYPRTLTADNRNNLFVADGNNHRVLIFHEAATKANGAHADVVLGQTNFTTSISGVTDSKFLSPRGIAIIDNGFTPRLSVCDRNNNRILIFGQSDITTDENTPYSGTLTGDDTSGSGGLTYSLVTQPSFGTVTIDNSSTGAFTYTPGGSCAVDTDDWVSFIFEITNANGCSVQNEMTIFVQEVGGCIEDCFNGIDDDLNGLTDRFDPKCDYDQDGVANVMDVDNDNDGILDTLECLVSYSHCPYSVSRVLYENDFGVGLRTSSILSDMCFENGGGVSCSSTYSNSTHTGSVDSGEYTVINNTDDANLGQHNWVSDGDNSSDPEGRMIIFNPSFIGQVLFEFQVDGIIPNVSTLISFKHKNLFKLGSGMQVPRMILNVLDTNGVVIHNTQVDIAETEIWYSSNMSYTYGNNSSVIFQFVNDHPTISGNDFALDNIQVTQNIRDCDNDGIANMYDLDSDNDGLTDIAEQNGADINFNGITDNIDGGLNLTNDLNSNGADDTYEGQLLVDTDLDLVIDIHDLDSDNDGIYDVLEALGDDADLNGKIGTGVQIDANNNGLSSLIDPAESGTGLVVKDSDSNGVIDAKQLDSDDDGCSDVIEAGFPDPDNNGLLGNGTIGSGLIVNNVGIVNP